MEVLFSAMIEEWTERMHTQISKKYYPFTNIRDTYRILWTIGQYFFPSTRWLRPIVHFDLYKDEVKKIWNP